MYLSYNLTARQPVSPLTRPVTQFGFKQSEIEAVKQQLAAANIQPLAKGVLNATEYENELIATYNDGWRRVDTVSTQQTLDNALQNGHVVSWTQFKTVHSLSALGNDQAGYVLGQKPGAAGDDIVVYIAIKPAS